MNRSVLLGLFVTASVLAAPSFASPKDQCQVNLQTLSNARAQLGSSQQANLDTSVQQAKAAEAQKTEKGTDDCVAITDRALLEIQNSQKGG
ncbi:MULTISPECIES: hypothetical protein [Pseudomonas]|uniref:hypothetical protein n=1 Tax=Pseudomonas TaxID=286 RepID=UPI000CD59933|nr:MULTISPECIES: hypothetical protein [Pseudomonas]MBV6753312.1 hypothetical protein [Pseudomonas chlororaphis]RBH57834.1 hypothetical protein C3F00_008765 [Pseudomonas sp. MWU13-2860]